MSDYSCNICYKIFNSPSHLERHINNKNPCTKPNLNKDILINYIRDATAKHDKQTILNLLDAIIESSIITTDKDIVQLYQARFEDKYQTILETELIQNKSFKCIDCNEEFTHKHSLTRHNKLNRCRAKKDGYSLDDILNATPDDAHIVINKPEVSINEITNSNVNIDASFKQYITNNYNIHFNIMPFGLESIEHITLKDFKYIFADASKLMNKLCNYVFLQNQSNISFYKHNLNKQIISFLSKNMEIEKIDEKGFIIQFTQLLEDTCILLFYQYKEQLTELELIKYMKKLVEYQDTILYEKTGVIQTDTKNCILNLMDSAFRNKDIKYNIEKIIKDLKENMHAKDFIVDRLKDEDYMRDDVINEFYEKPTSITHKMQMATLPAKNLSKIRKMAIEANKDETKARRKRAVENSLKDVKFSTADND